MFRKCSLVGVALASLSLSAQAATLLDVNFEGYTVGNLEGQSGGVMDGTWIAPATNGDFKVIDNFAGVGGSSLGSKAVTLTRFDGGGMAQVTMQGGVVFPAIADTGNKYFSVDFMKADADDIGIFWLLRQASGNHSAGFSIEPGENANLALYTDSSYTQTPTTYGVELGKWHRVEFELFTSPAMTFNAYVQKEGVAGRTQIAIGLPWGSANSYLDAFQYLPQYTVQSAVLADNIMVLDNVSLPVDRPFVVPEPVSAALLATGGLLLRRARRT